MSRGGVDIFRANKFATALNPLSQPNTVAPNLCPRLSELRPGNADDCCNRNT